MKNGNREIEIYTRRRFVRSSGLGLCAVFASQYIYGNRFCDQGKSIDQIRQLTLDYIEKMRLEGQP